MLLEHICFIIYSFLLSNILRYVLELVQITFGMGCGLDSENWMSWISSGSEVMGCGLDSWNWMSWSNSVSEVASCGLDNWNWKSGLAQSVKWWAVGCSTRIWFLAEARFFLSTLFHIHTPVALCRQVRHEYNHLPLYNAERKSVLVLHTFPHACVWHGTAAFVLLMV